MMIGEGKQLIGPLKPHQEPWAKGGPRGEGLVGQLKGKSGSSQRSLEQGYRICCSERWGQSGTVCELERSWAEWRMPVCLCSSKLRKGVTNTGLQVRSLGLGRFWKNFPFALKLLKCAYHTTGLQSQHKHVSRRLSSSRDFGSGTCWLTKGVLSFSYSLDNINLAEYNIFAYFPSPFPHAHIHQPPRVNPQDNLTLKEKMWWAYLKIWIQQASVCLASARLQRADSRRWTFTEIKAVSFCCCLFSRLVCPPESGFLKAWGFLFSFFILSQQK